MGWLDLIFPKNCVACKRFGSYLCEQCTLKIEYLNEQICPYCYKPAISGITHPRCSRKLGLDGVISLTNYKSPIKEVIKSLKYNFTTDLLSELKQKLKFPRELVSVENAIVVPLPLAKSRQNYRGFNQSEILGELVCSKIGIEYKEDLLERIRMTKPQVGLSQSKRAENVKGAFLVKRDLDKVNYYVFDDVWTSGATLKEVAAVLKKSGARCVWGLTLAHPR